MHNLHMANMHAVVAVAVVAVFSGFLVFLLLLVSKTRMFIKQNIHRMWKRESCAKTFCQRRQQQEQLQCKSYEFIFAI